MNEFFQTNPFLRIVDCIRVVVGIIIDELLRLVKDKIMEIPMDCAFV